jgi:hypothetical protein
MEATEQTEPTENAPTTGNTTKHTTGPTANKLITTTTVYARLAGDTTPLWKTPHPTGPNTSYTPE